MADTDTFKKSSGNSIQNPPLWRVLTFKRINFKKKTNLISMKHIITAVLSILSFGALAQSSTKLYGYRQTVSAGIDAGREIGPDGTMTKAQPKRMVNYFVYFTTTSKTRLYPVALFIEGVRYDVQSGTVKQTPVLEQRQLLPGQKAEVLVPKTTAVVYQLTPSAATTASAKAPTSAKTLARSNALVFVYRQGGKTYTRSLKTFTQLTPEAMQ